MALNTSKQERIAKLKEVESAGQYKTQQAQFALIDLVELGYIKSVVFEGPLMADQRNDSLANWDVYELTNTGLMQIDTQLWASGD